MTAPRHATSPADTNGRVDAFGLDDDRVQAAAEALATQLADPQAIIVDTATAAVKSGPAQSLANGALGIAVLHIERARAGLASWETAHTWLTMAARGDLSAGPNASLFFGAPALAFAIHLAMTEHPRRYQRALNRLDASVVSLTRMRLDAAYARIDRCERPALAEFDLITGLTGLGALLLLRDPHATVVRDVLSYLVRLTEPIPDPAADGSLPGWWSHQAPSGRVSADYPGGHGNAGIAHGITGPLALLSLAKRRGIIVNDHDTAIARIGVWLDTWRQHGATGTWWPEWVALDQQHRLHLTQPGPWRPSWCYGTPGLARSMQLAGIATADTTRQCAAESALLDCLNDPVQLARLSESGLCHGAAGLLHTVSRIAGDALDPSPITAQLPHLVDRILARRRHHRHDHHQGHRQASLLDGTAGVALALHAATAGTKPSPSWDACLLLT